MDSSEELLSNEDNTVSNDSEENVTELINEKEVIASKLPDQIEKLSKNKGYLKEYHELIRSSDIHVYSDFSDALKWENRSKNRYTNVLPCKIKKLKKKKLS